MQKIITKQQELIHVLKRQQQLLVGSAMVDISLNDLNKLFSWFFFCMLFSRFSTPFLTHQRRIHSVSSVYISQFHDPYLNLAIEEWQVCISSHRRLLQKRKDHETFLFLYRNQPCVVIGRNQARCGFMLMIRIHGKNVIWVKWKNESVSLSVDVVVAAQSIM
jgi:hypothetical protein